jgi:hypothetical protein
MQEDMTEREAYLRDLYRGMTIMCLFYAVPISLALKAGMWLPALGWWLAAEVSFRLCSVEPTEAWRRSRKSRRD